MKERINHFCSLLSTSSTTVSSLILGVPAVSGGWQIYLPTGGALRTTPAERLNSPAGDAGTMNIDEIEVDSKISSKVKSMVYPKF